MTKCIKSKEAFEIESKHGAFYTGGNIEWYANTIYCQTESAINLLNTEDGTVSKTVGGENNEDSDAIQTFTTDGARIVSSHKSGLLKLWNSDGELEKMWKYIHRGLVSRLRLNENRLASGGTDGSIRIWDLEHQACVLSLKGCQGVVNVVVFHPVDNKLLASGDDGKIFVWELEKGNLERFYSSHYSKVTSLAFTHDNEHFISCGRDKVIILWKFTEITPLKTIPLNESVDAIVSLPIKFKLPGFKADPDNFYVATGGEHGIVRIWDVSNAKEVYVQTNSLVSKASEGELAITNLLVDLNDKVLAVVTSDHNIILHHLKSFVCLHQYIGFSDEVLDICFLGHDDSHLAVATNSNDIKLYHNATMSCTILKGHTDLVLSLSAPKTNTNLLVSSSKDNSIRLWCLQDDASMKCVGIGKRHTGSVGSCCFSQTSANFIVSVSQDNCLKFWDVSGKLKEENAMLNCVITEMAHQKDINCVTVSPNDKIIATASQDKTAKLWTDGLNLIGVLKGHKRGVWCIRFSPIDQVVITSSADCSIKLWSVNELSCLKTLEGHESSVLRVKFISNGLQIISAGGDGLVKVFDIKSSECSLTLDGHEGRVWALAIKKDETRVVTGGSDSLMIKWKDVSEEKKLKEIEENEEQAANEQKLSNYLQNGKLLKALKLALRLDKPFQVLKIIQGVIKSGDTGLADTIKELRNDQKEHLLKCATSWNTNSKNCQPAQMVINILLNEMQTGDFRPVALPRSLEEVLPYTERHFNRLTHLLQDLHFISYTINCMKPYAKEKI